MMDMNSLPGERIGHIASHYHGYMLIWGGYRGYNDDLQTNYLASNELWIYDPFVEQWIKKTCVGEKGSSDIPPGTSGASGCVINDYLYVFGGYHEEGNSRNLYRLNINTLRWKLIEPLGHQPLPCDKSVCWEYNNKLYIFAGYGCVPNSNERSVRQRDYHFVIDVNSHWHYRRGWSNQFACYDPERNEWNWPKYLGKAPIARAAHAAAKVGSRVYIHGGRHGRTRMEDMYYIDMETMTWSDRILTHGIHNGHIPSGRSWHSLTPISSDAIILYGGFSQNNQPLNDCWMLHVPTLTWVQIEMSLDKPRLWHTAVYSKYGEVLVFGGGTQNILNYNLKNIYSGDVITIRFMPKSLFRLSLDAAINYSQQLQMQWPNLPLHIQITLNRRLESVTTNSDGS